MRITTSVFALVSVLGAPAAFAQEWRIEPVVRAGYEFDDNATLSILTIDEPEISGSIFDLSARFGYLSPTTEFYATPMYRNRNYGDEDYDAEEEFFDFRYRHEWQSSQFRLRGRYSNELVRTAERVDADIDIEDPDLIPDDTTDLVAVRDNRQRFEVIPSYSYDISEATTMSMNVHYTDVSYDRKLAGLLNDYNNVRANLDFDRNLSERTSALFGMTYRTYEAEGSDAISGYGLRGGIERLLSEKTRLRIVAGFENTETTDGDSKVDPVGEITLSRQLQTIRLLAQYRHVVSGGGSGNLTARDIINVNFDRNLTERVTAGIGVRAYATRERQQAGGPGPGTLEERDYVQLRMRFIWNMSRTFQFEANYRYTVLDRATLGESANSNNITLWINWRPSPYSSAR